MLLNGSKAALTPLTGGYFFVPARSPFASSDKIQSLAASPPLDVSARLSGCRNVAGSKVTGASLAGAREVLRAAEGKRRK